MVDTFQVQHRRGTSAQHAAFTGAEGEITFDTDKGVPVVHDGATVGGHPLIKAADVPLNHIKLLKYMIRGGY